MAMRSAPPRRGFLGFTLIEVMITVVIISILVRLALPTYREYVARARRLDAQATLLEAAQFMERFYTQNGRYDQTAGVVSNIGLPAGLQYSPQGSTGSRVMYEVKLVSTITTYTLQASPQNAQANDRCGAMSIDQKGVRYVTKGTVLDCWRR